jgi:hypothetical protein
MEPAHEGLGLLPSGVEVEGHGQKEIGEWAWHVNLHAPQNHHRPTVELLHVNHAVNQLLGNAEGLCWETHVFAVRMRVDSVQALLQLLFDEIHLKV